MDKPWKVIFAFIGVFMAGAVFGGLFTLRASAKRAANDLALSRAANPPAVIVQEKPEPVATTQPAAGATASTTQPPPRSTLSPQERNAGLVMKELIRRVNPTADQREKMRTIVARVTEDIQRSQRDHVQEVLRLNDRMFEDLGAVLSPEQRIQMERMRQDLLEHNRNVKEKQRLEMQSRGAVARPTSTQALPPPLPRKPGPTEAANPGR